MSISRHDGRSEIRRLKNQNEMSGPLKQKIGDGQKKEKREGQ